jgi:eukaryotic-like serine/threonine-protein kinase
MSLPNGTRLGPYEIVAPLGAGGMGEVYRARDTRLGRDVAIKVLPPSVSSDPERLRRFELEARAAGALNHPNILVIYDVGTQDGSAYLVSELLAGETLAERLRSGALPLRKALDIATQTARGIAAAHAKGITHRDLKPANIFITADGRVKILDFGLAKIERPGVPSGSSQTIDTLATQSSPETQSGTVLGTVGYMSPEQVRGKPADARSDIFSLGATLYEMLAGSRAFPGDSSVEIMNAILKEDPPDLSASNRNISPALERVIRRCLEKNPEERFQSASDLAFAIDALSLVSTSSATATDEGITVSANKHGALKFAAVFVAAAALGATALYFATLARKDSNASGVTISSVVMRQGLSVFNARFAPDGQTIVFSAARAGNTPTLYIRRPSYPQAQPSGQPGTHLLAISSKGVLSILTTVRYVTHSVFSGTLCEMELDGGAPREILKDVQGADWTPDGSGVAIIRDVDGHSRLEYPIGKVLHTSNGYLSELRFSPAGDKIAFYDHPLRDDDAGSLIVAYLAGGEKVLGANLEGAEGLTWSRDGKEIIYGALHPEDSNYNLRAVSLNGESHMIFAGLGDTWPYDVNAAGQFLITENNYQVLISGRGPGGKEDLNLSWFETSGSPTISADGRWLLFSSVNPSPGEIYDLCWRQTDGSPVVRIGKGSARDISPDKAWALSEILANPEELVLFPTGAGETRHLERGSIEHFGSARFYPDGKQILACGADARQVNRCYVQDVANGAPRPLTPEGTSEGFVAPDGSRILARAADGKFALFSIEGKQETVFPGLTPDDIVLRWSADGRSILVRPGTALPARIERVELLNGHRTFLREIGPEDKTAIIDIRTISIADDPSSYAYAFNRVTSRLAILNGVK